MDDRDLSILLHESWIKIQSHFDPVIKPLVTESGLSMREWMMLLAALTFEPEDITPSHLMVRGPYTSSEQYLMWLNKTAEQGYLINISNRSFRLTSKGRKAAEQFIKLAREAMAESDPLPLPESIALAEMLARLVDQCLETPPPPNTWSISLSNKLMPEIEPPMPFIEQAISCLSAYRDDAHLAAWRSSGLSATALESLTLIWNCQVSALDELTEKLSFRGHPKKVYMDALAELRTREFVSGINSILRITDEGKLFRARVEAKTEQYFFAPWSCLTQAEKERMNELVIKLRDEL